MKREVILIIILVVALISLSLYYTFAFDVSSDSTTGDADLTFDIDIKNPATRTVTVDANKTKVFDINVSSSNDVTIKYGIAYSGTKPDTVRIAQLNSSKDPVSGNIASNTTKNITIVIENKSSANYTYTLQVVAGYQNGGNLIVPNNYTLITDIYTFPVKPNKPDLVQGLIPVKYDEANSTWVKADSTNTNNDWYDYDNKIWANAVLVCDTNRTTYMNANAGTAIPESDVLAYYVWIPRYKYKVWNINKVVNTDSYNAKTTGIDIVFENGTQSSGTVSCNYNFAITDGSLSEICTGNNGDYYTHPAFTFGDKQVRGIWVGKFEISSETPSATNGGGQSTSLTVRVKPNVAGWRTNLVTNFYKVIYDMQIENNIYGLSTNRSNTDSHVLKNTEWGVVAYLTNSKYGRCTNNTCTEVTINNSSDYITGNAGSSISAGSASGTTNTYDTASGQLASTTGNIYGIYDMSGGAYEYVMGNMSSVAGSYTYYASNAVYNYTYQGYEKYIDTYANGSTSGDQTAYNRSRLGDATGETKSWNKDSASFVNSTKSWFIRSGNFSNTIFAGPFNFSNSDGGNGNDRSARSALLSLSS